MQLAKTIWCFFWYIAYSCSLLKHDQTPKSMSHTFWKPDMPIYHEVPSYVCKLLKTLKCTFLTLKWQSHHIGPPDLIKRKQIGKPKSSASVDNISKPFYFWKSSKTSILKWCFPTYLKKTMKIWNDKFHFYNGRHIFKQTHRGKWSVEF